ncbi:nuclear transport factor 2 family protein [Actinacidiphila acidipaludis]|uniref:Nuclear transport factor 2 family protein n=1 Tax=Actinacidiphila acidipaludis TaxID=2873382 RepID=A0ABS7QIA9_9ACTN|nr:nuclear transport factor 2 family protein [Streptomyces acidipaludis]MBY8882909.1 nuclear transport factor 2 family protein [Streptomyces acidipaludis]
MECGDLDGYASLLDDDVIVDRPDAPTGRGRAEVLRMHQDRLVPKDRHVIERIVADGDHVVVIGSIQPPAIPAATQPASPASPAGRVAFVDVFTLSDIGMLLACRRYYFAAPV